MGRASLVIPGGAARSARLLAGIVAVAAVLTHPALAGDAPAAAAPLFPQRLVKLGGSPSDPAVRAHVAWAEAAGFNGFFVYSSEAGAWATREAPRGPALRPEFVAFARAAAARGTRIVVSVNPVADSGGEFRFADKGWERRLVRFLDLLRRKAGVREFVVSFDDQPTRLTALADVLEYGWVAAPAHLDLVRRIEARLRPGDRLWMCAAAYCDRHLGNGAGPYGAAFLAGLKALPPRVGIVWTGPEIMSREITAEGLGASRARLGGREIFLYDNYPVNDDPGDALGLVLGPLRKRDPRLAAVAATYLACPMTQLAASRLPLATTAAWLADPAAYVPSAAWQRAIRDLAGPDPEVREALETQALEWGGWIEETTWRHRDRANPIAAAAALDDPAAVDRWTWTVERYPARIAAVAKVADVAFRDDVVRIMKRRLAVARAVPLAVEYLERQRAGRPDAAAILPAIDDVRRDDLFDADARWVLDRFLAAAGIPLPSP